MGNWISQKFQVTGEEKDAKKFVKGISKLYWEQPLILSQHKDYYETYGRTKNTIHFNKFKEVSKKLPKLKIKIIYQEDSLQICGVMFLQNGKLLVKHGEPVATKEPWVFINPYKDHELDGTEEEI